MHAKHTVTGPGSGGGSEKRQYGDGGNSAQNVHGRMYLGPVKITQKAFPRRSVDSSSLLKESCFRFTMFRNGTALASIILPGSRLFPEAVQ